MVNEFEGYVKLNKKVSPEVVGVVQQIDDYAKLADTIASHLAVKIADEELSPENFNRHSGWKRSSPVEGEICLLKSKRKRHRSSGSGKNGRRVLSERTDGGD